LTHRGETRLVGKAALVNLAAKSFHLFFQFQLASLEFANAKVVGGWPIDLFLDRSIERFVPGAEFANSRFYRHGWASILRLGLE
jgi:hypothetical protein